MYKKNINQAVYIQLGLIILVFLTIYLSNKTKLKTCNKINKLLLDKMATLDETIIKCNDKFISAGNVDIHFDQIAKWLQELKNFRQMYYTEDFHVQDVDSETINKLSEKRTGFINPDAIQVKVIGEQCYFLGFHDALNHANNPNYIQELLEEEK